MNILDRLKSQPPWKDPDPLVRIDGVFEIPDEEQDLLTSIVREDADPRVRQAVAPRVQDPSVLAELVRSDADPAVQAAAGDTLSSIACEAGDDDARALAALAGLTDSRHVARVAKHATLDAVGLAALERLSDAKVVSGLAKQSGLAAVRLEATSRVDDPADLSAIAQNSEHKDSALAALERISDPESLKSIAARAQNKVAGRRAKAMLRAAEEPSATADPPATADPEDRSVQLAARQTDLCSRLEALASLDDEARLEAELEASKESWRAALASPDAQPDEAGLADRFAAACDAVSERLATLAADRTTRERLADERMQQLAPHRALCESAETLPDDATPDRVAELRTEWAALPDVEGPEFAAVTTQFQRACSAVEDRLARAATDRLRREQLDALLADAETLVGDRKAADAVDRWRRIQKTWRSALAESAPGSDQQARFEAAEAAMVARAAADRDARARRQQEALARLRRLAERLEGLITSDETTLKNAERAMRDIRRTLDQLTGVRGAHRPTGSGGAASALNLPTKQDRDALTAHFQKIQTALFPRLEELRQADDWQRWANASVQEQLCARMEALVEADDLAEASRQIRRLQDEWKAVRTAPRDRSEALWHRFKSASDKVRERCQPLFAEKAQERATNHARKEGLCEQVEALADSSDWIRTADAIKKLQVEWKAIGPGLHEKATWERFRSACDRFFTRRKDDLAQRKKVWSANLAAKVGLCEQAEALAGSTEWEATAAAIRKLQAEWKAIGPVQRSRSETIWKRFRTACDQFFDAYHGRDKVAQESNLAERERVCTELEALLPTDEPSAPTDGPDALVDTVRSLRSRWAQAGDMTSTEARKLATRFDGLIRRLAESYPTRFKGTDLDVHANVEQLERLCERVESFVKDEPAVTSTATLAAQLKEALAANTIGGAVTDEARWRSMTDEVREAQTAFKRVGLAPSDVSHALHDRFRRACDRFFNERRKHQPPRTSGVGARPHQTPRRGSR